MATVSISVTQEDFIAGARLAKKGRRWPRVLFAAAAAAATLLGLDALSAIANGAAWSDELLKIPVVCAAIALYALYQMTDIPAWLACRRTGSGEPMVNQWTPEGLELRTGDHTRRYGWEEFRRWTEDSRSIVAFTRGSNVRIPKRTISPADLAELRHYLEGRRAAPRTPAAAPSGRNWVRLTETDHVAVAVAEARKKRRIAYLLLAPISVLVVFGWRAGEVDVIAPASLVVVLAALIWSEFSGAKWQAGAYRKLVDSGELPEFAVSPEGLDHRSHKLEGRMDWSRLRLVRETPEVLMLGAGNATFPLPKRGFDPGEIEAVKGYLRAVG